MSTADSKTLCTTCGKAKTIFKCGGCQQDFCYNHSTDHRQELSQQLDSIEVSRDLFRQRLTEQTHKPQHIDKWERDSIEKIRRVAEEARQELLKYNDQYRDKLNY
jgi:hypothetical protein